MFSFMNDLCYFENKIPYKMAIDLSLSLIHIIPRNSFALVDLKSTVASNKSIILSTFLLQTKSIFLSY